MEKVYMVIADYSSDVPYGIDEKTYLCGIYKTEDEANKRAERLRELVGQCQAEFDDYIERYNRMVDGKLWEELDEMDNKGDTEDAIYEKYKDILGFSIRGYADGQWDVDIVVNCISFGDLGDYCLTDVAYAE